MKRQFYVLKVFLLGDETILTQKYVTLFRTLGQNIRM